MKLSIKLNINIKHLLGVAEARKETDHHLQPNISTLTQQGRDWETLIKLHFVLFHKKKHYIAFLESRNPKLPEITNLLKIVKKIKKITSNPADHS